MVSAAAENRVRTDDARVAEQAAAESVGPRRWPDILVAVPAQRVGAAGASLRPFVALSVGVGPVGGQADPPPLYIPHSRPAEHRTRRAHAGTGAGAGRVHHRRGATRRTRRAAHRGGHSVADDRSSGQACAGSGVLAAQCHPLRKLPVSPSTPQGYSILTNEPSDGCALRLGEPTASLTGVLSLW
jgi:hypothetical protein